MEVPVIDFRARPNTPEYMQMYNGRPGERSWDRFGYPRPEPVALEVFIYRLCAAGVRHAVFTGRRGPQGYVSNDYVAECARKFPSELTGFASVDPPESRKALPELDRALGVLGLKPVPVDPPDGSETRGVPVVLTLGPLMGHFSDPYAIDHIAVHFPELMLVCSHACWSQLTDWTPLVYRRPSVFLEPSIYVFPQGCEPFVEAANSFCKVECCMPARFHFSRSRFLSVSNAFRLGPMFRKRFCTTGRAKS
jgi:hypothetical protein